MTSTDSMRRLVSLLLSLAILAIPAVIAVLTAGPMGCGGSGCMNT
jgi:hypothetical protein